jgi:hypothetical protein
MAAGEGALSFPHAARRAKSGAIIRPVARKNAMRSTTSAAPAPADHAPPGLPRYERRREDLADALPIAGERVSAALADDVIARSDLSEGGKALLRGLLRTGTIRRFPGGVGIEYGGLLKTAARPDYVAAHVREAAAHLRERNVDLLLVPGMSGYPIGAMYAIASGIPAVLLKKVKASDAAGDAYPAGAFVIPSYTGEGDVVMHADPPATQDIVDTILAPQLDAQRDVERPVLAIRAAGADDIIDKATMSHAVSESAIVIGRVAIADFVRRHRARTGDAREFEQRVEVVAWATPLIKGYNRPHEHLWETFRVVPFAGLNVGSVHLDPPAIGIDGVGVIAFSERDAAS